jgi:adenosylcobyric acid synthase
MGETNGEPQRFPFEIIQRSGKQVAEFDGAVSDHGLHFGTYLHGLFNSDDFRRGFLDQLRKRKGLKPIQARGFSYIKRLQDDYDELAAVVRENLRLDLIYELLNIHKKGK